LRIFLDYLFTAVYRRDICTALLFVWLRLFVDIFMTPSLIVWFCLPYLTCLLTACHSWL
jgi:hypothetical protein